MSNGCNDPVYLHRIDPKQNMRRFYSLAIQPTLFGGVSLILNGGRIGTNGRLLVETFDESKEAVPTLAKLERTRRRRGYKSN